MAHFTNTFQYCLSVELLTNKKVKLYNKIMDALPLEKFGMVENYELAAAMAYDIGLRQAGVDRPSQLHKRFRHILPTAGILALEPDELILRGVAYEAHSLPAEPVFYGMLYTPGYDTVIFESERSLTASKHIANHAQMCVELVGHMSDPHVRQVSVRSHRAGKHKEATIYDGEAAQRIGGNILTRVVQEFYHRLTRPLIPSERFDVRRGGAITNR